MESNTNENVDYEALDYFMNSPNWELLNRLPEGVWVNDLKNERNGRLVAHFPFKNHKIKDPSIYWLCKCDCGSFIMCRADRFRNTPHCGCEDIKDYVGEKHGHLTCVSQNVTVNENGHRTLRLEVKCNCGKKFKTTPSKYLNQNCCGMTCPFKMSEEDKKANGERMKEIFYKGTNLAKVGRDKPNRNSTTGYIGVTYVENMKKYMSYITFQGKREDLGYYPTADQAAYVRSIAQDMLHAQYLNEIKEDDFVRNNEYLTKLANKVRDKIIGRKETQDE